MIIGSATGLGEVNVGSAYPGERQEHWESQCGCHKKDVTERREIADNAHEASRREAADRGEALIAAEPLSERLVPNESQTDGGDCRANDASSRALNDSRSEDGREVRPQSEDQ
jgi:hypothetical protein